MRDNGSKALNNDGGAVAIMVALLAIVLFGMAAFAVDMGMAYASKRELSVTSDAASLAGANAAAVAWRTQYPAATPCTTEVADAVTPAAAQAAVAMYDAQLPVNSDGDPAVTVTCADAGTMDVKVDASATYATVFGAVLGQDELNPGATATARVSGSPAYSGVRPFAICIDDVEVELEGPLAGGVGPTKQTEFSFNGTGSVECNDTPPGNWGIVDFDGGSNPNPEIEDWTANGYDGVLGQFPQSMPGNPGAGFNTAGLQAALDSIVGEIVLFPVASQWQEDGGNNATFTADGLAAVEVCGWYISPKKNNGANVCWEESLLDGLPSDVDLVIQWRQIAWTTSYSGSGGPDAECDLSTDPYCVPAVRLHL